MWNLWKTQEQVVFLSDWDWLNTFTGNLVAIGAFYNGGNGAKAGLVRIYNWNGACIDWRNS